MALQFPSFAIIISCISSIIDSITPTNPVTSSDKQEINIINTDNINAIIIGALEGFEEVGLIEFD